MRTGPTKLGSDSKRGAAKFARLLIPNLAIVVITHCFIRTKERDRMFHCPPGCLLKAHLSRIIGDRRIKLIEIRSASANARGTKLADISGLMRERSPVPNPHYST